MGYFSHNYESYWTCPICENICPEREIENECIGCGYELTYLDELEPDEFERGYNEREEINFKRND